MKRFLFFAIFFSVSFLAFAANRYWVGPAGGAWNNDANWSNASGGASGFSYPVAGDDVTFDGNGTNNCTLTATAACSSLTIASTYTGTLNTAGYLLSVSNDMGINGGSFTGRLDINGNFTQSGGATTLNDGTANRSYITGNFTISGGTFTNNLSDYLMLDNGIANINSGGLNLGRIFINNSKTLVNNNLTCTYLEIDTGSTLNTGAFNLTVNGNTAVNGTLNASGQGGGNTTSITGNLTDLAGTGVAGTLTGGAGAINIDGNVVINNFTGSSGVAVNTNIAGDFNVNTFTHNSGSIVFDGTGSINQATNFYDLEVSNGTRSIPGSVTIGVANDLTISGGTLNGTNDTFNVGGSWTNSAGVLAFTETLSTVNFNAVTGGTISTETFNNMQIIAAGTWSTTGNITVSGTYLQNNGTLRIGANTLDLTGLNPSLTGGIIDMSTTTGGTISYNALTFNLNGTSITNLGGAGVSTISGTGTFSITNAASSVTCGNNSAITCGAFSINNGSYSAGAAATSIINCTSFSQAGGTFNGGTGVINNSGNFTVSSGTFNAVNSTSNIGGNVSIGAGLIDITGGTSTLNFNGNANQTFNSGGNNYDNIYVETTGASVVSLITTDLGNVLELRIIDGVFDINGQNIGTITTFNNDFDGGDDATFTLNGTEILGGITNDTNSGRVRYKNNATITTGVRMSDTFYDLEIAGTVLLGSNITVNHDLIISAGSLDASGGGGRTINVTRNWNNSAGAAAFTETTSTVNFTGTGAIQNAETFYNMTISGGTRTQTGNQTINNNLTFGAGGTYQPGANSVLVGRNWDNSAGGTFTNAGSTVTFFDNGGTSTVSGTTNFNNFTCTTAGKQIDITGDNNYNNFTVTTAGAGQTLTFTNTTIQWISGTLTLTGGAAVANKIKLRSDIAASWIIRVDAAQAVTNVDVQYSNVHDSSGGNITANTSINNTGTNDDAGPDPYWVFTPTTSITWTGASSSDWNTTTNWNAGYVPNITDNVIIPDAGTTANDPVITTAQSITVNNLTIANNGILSITNTGSLTISNSFLNLGTGATLNIANPTNFNSTAPVANTGTINYTGTVTDNIDFTTYYNLTISGTGTFTAAADTTINGTITISNGVFNATGRTIYVGRDWNNTAGIAAFTETGSTVNFNNAAGGTIQNAEIFNNITISAGNRTLNANLTILGNWDQSGGSLTPGTTTVSFDGAAGVTQQITTNGQAFYNLTVTDQATRTVQLLSNITISNDFIFNNGIFDVNNVSTINIGHDLLVYGGLFTDNNGGSGMTSTTTFNISNNFDALANNANINFEGRSSSSRWKFYVNPSGATNYGRVRSGPIGTYTYIVSATHADSTSTYSKQIGSAYAEWPTYPPTTIVDCINWWDDIAPYIVNTRARIGDNRIYVEFSEVVKNDATLSNIVPGDFNLTSGLTINTIDRRVFSDNVRFIFRFSLPGTITISEYLNSIIQNNNASPRIIDDSFNPMYNIVLYRLSYHQPIRPETAGYTGYGIGIDFFTNIELKSIVNTEKEWGLVNDFSGNQNIYYNGLVLTATMDSGISGTPKIYYIIEDSKDNNQFYIPALTSDVKTAEGKNIGGNKWTFEIPADESDNNKYIKMVLSVNTNGNEWFCYRSLYPVNSNDTQFYKCATYIVRLKRIALQNNNTTILNNVINPRYGETTKLLYTLEKEGPVSIVVYDLKSDLVKVLKGGNETKGLHSVTWDGKNENGKIVTRGVYFIRIRAPGIFNQIRKVLIIK